MVSQLPERRHIKYAPSEVPEGFKVPDLIGLKYDPEGIASALGADSSYNDKTGAWSFILQEAREGEFRPVLGLIPNVRATDAENIRPTLSFTAAVDEEPVIISSITGIKHHPGQDKIEFQSMGKTGLIVFMLTPRGVFTHQRFPTAL